MGLVYFFINNYDSFYKTTTLTLGPHTAKGWDTDLYVSDLTRQLARCKNDFFYLILMILNF